MLNFIHFSALFGLFLIGWSINHVLYLNVTLEFQKTVVEMVAKIRVQVPKYWHIHFIMFLLAVCNENLAMHNQRSDK